jgi:hypothetical protein
MNTEDVLKELDRARTRLAIDMMLAKNTAESHRLSMEKAERRWENLKAQMDRLVMVIEEVKGDE